jgi:hypothetical protein
MSTTETAVRTSLERRGRQLEYATVIWNSTEASRSVAQAVARTCCWHQA